jgi:hypothetical protein
MRAGTATEARSRTLTQRFVGLSSEAAWCRERFRNSRALKGEAAMMAMIMNGNSCIRARVRVGLKLATLTLAVIAPLGISLMPTTVSADDIFHNGKFQFRLGGSCWPGRQCRSYLSRLVLRRA